MLNLPPQLRRLAKSVVALPYRFRFGSLGSGVRIMPPLMLFNPRGVCVGHRVIIEQYVGLSVAGGAIDIGDDCELRCFARLEAHAGSIRVGARSSVNSFTLLSGFGGLTVGSDVRIGSHSQVLSSTHRFEEASTSIRQQGVEPAATCIEDDVWIGSGCTIVGGVTVGRGSVIGAGAVVTKSVAPRSIMAGVPARVIGARSGP